MSTPQTAAFIALGANLGDPLTTLRWAVTELRTLGTVKALSRLYRTAPVGGPAGQPEYLNAATCLHTPLSAPDLLAGLHEIEARAGRTRTERWEARTLDLDLIPHGPAPTAGAWKPTSTTGTTTGTDPRPTGFPTR